MFCSNEEKLNVIVNLLRKSKRILFITGAGISADSGLPTYRGVGGLYNRGRTEEGYTIEECLSGSMFQRQPEITWKYMFQLGIAVAEHQPNDAHRIIAEWEKRLNSIGGKVVVVTQNIDNYHRAAGSRNVYEFHGSLRTLYCTACSWSEELETDKTALTRFKELQKTLLPCCPECHAVIRPRVVLFEESLPFHEIEQFQYEFNNGKGFDLVFSIGTSAMFPYITNPVRMAALQKIPTIEINPVESDLSYYVEIHLPMRAAEALLEIEKQWNKKLSAEISQINADIKIAPNRGHSQNSDGFYFNPSDQ
ncbi:MAG: NAD-dependent protein deacylase [Planctomycetaceae bacterium]|jgi:NAD-dependent deacetylase|nr:NAD-dependent protein deacylase [Planctomycetaceae bacterium]